MDEFTSDLASQGVNNNSKSKFLDIGSEFSKLLLNQECYIN